MLGNPILDLVFHSWPMHALFAASRLKIFTVLASRAMTAAELSKETSAEPRIFTALLDACVGMGLVQLKDGVYSNSHLSDAYLVEGRPLYLGDMIEVQATEAADWPRLYDVIIGNAEEGAATSRAEVDPRCFTLAMNSLAMLGEAEALAAAVDLSGCRTMVDVGCGSGMYSVALCRRNPDLNSVLLDRKEVLQVAREIVKRHSLQDRINTRESDITQDAYGEGINVVLLSDILYQDRATCKAILRLAHDALVVGGRLVVRGYYSDSEGSNTLFGALFVLKLQLGDPDREPISVPTLCEWTEEVGFRNVHAFALTERSSCLLAARS